MLLLFCCCLVLMQLGNVDSGKSNILLHTFGDVEQAMNFVYRTGKRVENVRKQVINNKPSGSQNLQHLPLQPPPRAHNKLYEQLFGSSSAAAHRNREALGELKISEETLKRIRQLLDNVEVKKELDDNHNANANDEEEDEEVRHQLTNILAEDKQFVDGVNGLNISRNGAAEDGLKIVLQAPSDDDGRQQPNVVTKTGHHGH